LYSQYYGLVVRVDYTGVRDELKLTDTTCTIYHGIYWTGQRAVKKESKEKKRTRLALEKNRASWVQFNEPKPKIKQVFKPINNFNKRR